MESLTKFYERLGELMDEQGTTAIDLAKALEVNYSTINHWLAGRRNIFLSNALKLADYFNCSLDFLFGKSETRLDYSPKECLPFYKRLRQVMKQKEVTRYSIVKNKIVSDSNISSWANGGDPFMQTVIDLANYFNLTLDQFVGREKSLDK